MTHQAVSRNIQKLEDEIGYKLFIRGAQSMSLSKAGEFMLDWLTEMDDRYEWANDYFYNEQNHKMHVLRVAFVDWTGLPECAEVFLKDMKENDQNFDVELYPGSEDFALDLLHRLKADAIIVPDYAQQKEHRSPDIFNAPLLEEETLQLCYSREFVNSDGGVDYKRLLSQKLLRCTGSGWHINRFNTLHEALCLKHGIAPAGCEEMPNFNSVISEVVLGNGFTFFSGRLPYVDRPGTLLKLENLSQFEAAAVPMVCVWRLTTRSEALLKFTETVCKI